MHLPPSSLSDLSSISIIQSERNHEAFVYVNDVMFLQNDEEVNNLELIVHLKLENVIFEGVQFWKFWRYIGVD